MNDSHPFPHGLVRMSVYLLRILDIYYQDYQTVYLKNCV